MTILLSIIAAVIVCVVLYSLAVHRWAKANIWPWWNTFLATVLSIVSAFVIGLMLYSLQIDSQDKDDRNRFYRLLGAEVSDILDNLNNPYSMTVFFGDGGSAKAGITFVHPIVLEDAGRSGLFTARRSRNMLHLVAEAKIYNMHVSYFNSIRSIGPNGPFAENQVRSALKRVEGCRETLVKHCESFATHMGLDTVDTWKDFTRIQ